MRTILIYTVLFYKGYAIWILKNPCPHWLRMVAKDGIDYIY